MFCETKRGFKKLQYQCKAEAYNLEYQLKSNSKHGIVIQWKTRNQDMTGWKPVR